MLKSLQNTNKKNSQNTCNTSFCKCSLPFFSSQSSFWSTALTLPQSLTSHSLFTQENFTPTSTLTSPNTGIDLQRDLQMTCLSPPSGLLCYTWYYWPSIYSRFLPKFFPPIDCLWIFSLRPQQAPLCLPFGSLLFNHCKLSSAASWML